LALLQLALSQGGGNANLIERFGNGVSAMERAIGLACGAGFSVLAVVVMSAGPSWAGANPTPAPLIGVTGPFGLLAAGAAYGGYLLYKRFQHRD
jgi:hypothetical protein